MNTWYAYNMHKNRILKNWHIASTDGSEIATLTDISGSHDNAKLIAAAPELLEAIRTVYSRVMNTNINTPLKDMSDTWDILREALDGK